MILYDDKHNFLGMSSHTLGFLGYEDVSEFLSMHNDFSNLFVQKEGFIYDFDNFNWIDFVLYSGAANKSAIITLKNGRETQVDLSIKEVHLGEDLNGIKKLYSVKVISDKFHEISGVPKSSETVGGVGGFSLSGLVEKESLKEEKIEVQEEKSTFQNLIIDSKQPEEKKSESFILNIAEDELITKEEEIVEKISVPDPQEDFKLDFFKNDASTQEPEESSDFLLKTTEPEVNDKEEPAMDFLLKSDDLKVMDPQEEASIEEPKSTSETFEFNLLKDEIQENVPSLDLEPNLLKTAELPMDEVVDEQTSATEDSGFKLDFLKMDLEPISEPEASTPESASTESNYNAVNNKEIIQQIKEDIKEIDSVDEALVASKTTEDETFVLNIPQMPQVEQPLEIEQQKETSTAQREEAHYEASQSSFQIQESKSQDSNKSFTSTLQSLFGTKDKLSEQHEADQSHDQTFAFTLKNNQEEKVEDIDNKEDITVTNDIKVEEKKAVPNNIQNVTFSSLSALGLSPDDEFDLLSDFINDAKESIETIEQFTGTRDFDKINYSLVKIKSSAEILNLNAIIDDTNSIRKHCITENSEKVIQETKKLKENIGLLEKQLEATAI